jgi:hypothetical protein
MKSNHSIELTFNALIALVNWGCLLICLCSPEDHALLEGDG